MHFGKCQIYCCCLDANEVGLLCDAKATLKQKTSLMLAGRCSSRVDPGLVSLVASSFDHDMFECGWHEP